MYWYGERLQRHSLGTKCTLVLSRTLVMCIISWTMFLGSSWIIGQRDQVPWPYEVLAPSGVMGCDRVVQLFADQREKHGTTALSHTALDSSTWCDSSDSDGFGVRGAMSSLCCNNQFVPRMPSNCAKFRIQTKTLFISVKSLWSWTFEKVMILINTKNIWFKL